MQIRLGFSGEKNMPDGQYKVTWFTFFFIKQIWRLRQRLLLVKGALVALERLSTQMVLRKSPSKLSVRLIV